MVTGNCGGLLDLENEVAQNCAGVVPCFNLRSHKNVQWSFLDSNELALICVRVGPQLCVPESRHQNILAFFITYKNRKQNRFNSRESINGEF